MGPDERIVELVVKHRFGGVRSHPWAVNVTATRGTPGVGELAWITASGVDLVVPPGRNHKLLVSSISQPGGNAVEGSAPASDTPLRVFDFLLVAMSRRRCSAQALRAKVVS